MSFGKSSSDQSGHGEGAGYTGGYGLNAGLSSATGGSTSTSASTGQSTNASQNQSSSFGQNQASSTQNIWGPQGQALTSLYGGAADIYSQGQPAITNQGNVASNMIADVQSGAMPAYNQQLTGGVYGNQNMDQSFNQSLANAMSGPTNAQNTAAQGANTYQDAMKKAIMNDTNFAADQMLANTASKAVASGMSGGSRQGVMEALGYKNLNDAALRNMADVGYKAYESDMDRQMNAALAADQNLLAQQGLMQNYMQGQQQGQQFGLGQAGNMAQLGMAGFDPIAAQWGGAQNLAQILGGPTVLGQSQSSGLTGSQSSGSSFGQSTQDSLSQSDSFNQSDAFNFGLNENFGENYNWNTSEGGSSSSNAGI